MTNKSHACSAELLLYAERLVRAAVYAPVAALMFADRTDCIKVSFNARCPDLSTLVSLRCTSSCNHADATMSRFRVGHLPPMTAICAEPRGEATRQHRQEHDGQARTVPERIIRLVIVPHVPSKHTAVFCCLCHRGDRCCHHPCAPSHWWPKKVCLLSM